MTFLMQTFNKMNWREASGWRFGLLWLKRRTVRNVGEAGVKEFLFISNFLRYVFIFISTWARQLHPVFSHPSVHGLQSQRWQSVWWHSAALCAALCSYSNLAAHSAQRVSSSTARRPSEQNRKVHLWNRS